MTLYRASEKPGDWTRSMRGKSGTRYRLRFHVNEFMWLGIWTEAHAGKAWSYMYWRRIWYRKARNGVVPRSNQVIAAFADIGINDIPGFVSGRHVNFVTLLENSCVHDGQQV